MLKDVQTKGEKQLLEAQQGKTLEVLETHDEALESLPLSGKAEISAK